jgi:hypothetical protein
MIEIKNLEGIVTRLYSFESKEEKIKGHIFLCRTLKEYEVLFNGTKSELREKPNEWWEGIVHLSHYFGFDNYYKDYLSEEKYCATAKESGLSLLESVKEEFIIICQESH